MTVAVTQALFQHRWPGNVRELKNTIERVLILEADDEIRREHLPLEIVGPVRAEAGAGADPFPAGVVRRLEEIEDMLDGLGRKVERRPPDPGGDAS